MVEYIEREAIKKLMLKYGFKAPDMTVTEFVNDELSSVDVVSILHGRWIEYLRAHYFKCSECKYTVPYRKAALHDGYREYNYCPHCGAKMDG